MTGTMVNGRLDSVYPFVRLINPSYYPTHENFLRHHAIMDEVDNKVIGWRNHERLAEIFRRHSIRRTRAEVYGPDAIVRHVEYVSMTPQQREFYKDLEDRALIELEDLLIDASMPGSFTTRCRQVMEHPDAVPTPLGIRDLVGGKVTGKDERLLVHVADHVQDGSPLVVFASLVKQTERLERLLRAEGLQTGLINGAVPAKRRNEVDAAFRAGELQALVVTAATAGVGYNWAHCDHYVMASIDYMDTSIPQAEARFCRGPRTTPLRGTFLRYRDCRVEDRMYQIVGQKSEDASKVDPTRPELRLDVHGTLAVGGFTAPPSPV